LRLPNIVFLVNGGRGSAMDIRARSFSERLSSDFCIEISYRTRNKFFAIVCFLWRLCRIRPALCYVFDMGFSGVLAAGIYRNLSRCRMVVDTGDAIYELGRSSGRRGLALWMTKALERFALSAADRIVVRSHPHQELYARQGIATDVIPDGVDLSQFSPRMEEDLRRQYNLDRCTVIGVLGSLIWNPRTKMCYGWDLLEVIERLSDRPVKGLIIGDGSGLMALKKQCAARGLEDRVVFLGRIPYDQLPRFLNLMDICISTQTNDVVGQVRTTGKLPLYLASGRFVLASKVGEAARVLPPEMLVPYLGAQDSEYPARIAARVEALLDAPEALHQQERSVLIARTHFEYDLLTAKVRQTIKKLLPQSSNREQESTIQLGHESRGK
jgi:glycosyltransferase involved in cell wall biosynthesis